MRMKIHTCRKGIKRDVYDNVYIYSVVDGGGWVWGACPRPSAFSSTPITARLAAAIIDRSRPPRHAPQANIIFLLADRLSFVKLAVAAALCRE
jgi:hypothetical protein